MYQVREKINLKRNVQKRTLFEEINNTIPTLDYRQDTFFFRSYLDRPFCLTITLTQKNKLMALSSSGAHGTTKMYCLKCATLHLELFKG